ncbi:MAG: hypothetical protein JSU01_10810 [Bacteroidetes bacterium]|nr:hypothetical protein [Bacteroidota bacterium]
MRHFLRCFILLPLTNLYIICQAQSNTSFFQNFEIANHKIYVLHADGILKIFDENGKLSDTYSPKNKIKQLVKDRDGNIIIVDSANFVKRLNHAEQWSTVTSFTEGTIYGLGFNSANDCFLVTNKGVLDIKTQKIFFPEKKLFQSEWAYRGNNGWELEDSGSIYTYLDKDDNMWFGFYHGEWGSDIFIWNTRDFNFTSPGYWNIVPSYESNEHLFAITGNIFDEYVVQMDKVYDKNKKLIKINGLKVYNTQGDSTYQKAESLHHKPHPGIKSLNELDWYNFYVGGFTFKPSDGRCYIITSDGLLTTDQLNKNTKFGDLHHVKAFTFPKEVTKGYIYYGHEKHETSIKNNYPQSISKIQFNSTGNLVMLAPAFGVWLFDGKHLKIIE